MNVTVEARAVRIAAKVMRAAGLCRYEERTKCHRLYADDKVCENCIRRWLIQKAERELEMEEKA